MADSRLGMGVKKQNEFLHDFQTTAKPLVGRTVGTVLGVFAMIFLIPVYTFLFMFYKTLLLNFFYESFDDNHSKEVDVVLRQTKGAVPEFYARAVAGSFGCCHFEFHRTVVAVGVKYAILLGVLGALLNILPYVGGIIAISLPVLIATVTKDGFNTQLGIVAAYLVIQFIDNNFWSPIWSLQKSGSTHWCQSLWSYWVEPCGEFRVCSFPYHSSVFSKLCLTECPS